MWGSPVATRAVRNVSRVLEQVPGVEVVGLLERTFMDDFCYTGDQPGYPTTPRRCRPGGTRSRRSPGPTAPTR